MADSDDDTAAGVALVNAHCARLPGAALSQPFGPGVDCWKVGGKIFALCGGRPSGVSFKCADAAQAAMLIEIGVVVRAPYLPRGGWVRAAWRALEDDDLRVRLTTSYRVVRQSLPKRAQAALDPLPD